MVMLGPVAHEQTAFSACLWCFVALVYREKMDIRSSSSAAGITHATRALPRAEAAKITCTGEGLALRPGYFDTGAKSRSLSVTGLIVL